MEIWTAAGSKGSRPDSRRVGIIGALLGGIPMNCECGDTMKQDSYRGETFCPTCGLVADARIFDSQIQAGTEFSGSIHNGVPLTRIRNESHDAGGGSINEGTRQKMRRLKRIDSTVTDNRSRSLKKLYAEVKVMGDRLNSTKELRDRAFFLAKQAHDKKVLRNQEFALMAGASFILAAQESGGNISFDEVLKVINIAREKPKKQLFRAYRVVKQVLGMQAVSVSPDAIIAVGISKLGLPPALERKAKGIYDAMPKHRTIRVDAAVAVFIAAKNVPQSRVADAFGVSDVIIRSRMAEQVSSKAL